MTHMRAHYLQHVPFEGLGSIEAWLESHAYRTTVTRLFKGEALPSLDEIDLLIILGGPMSVNDEEAHSWLNPEKQFIRNTIERKIPTLGICLGSQLIASALGMSIYPNPEKEIGWFPIQGMDEHTASCFKFPQSQTVFHWHGETYDLPEKAKLLASSTACKNQAFQIGGNVIGLQFHLETTPGSTRLMVENCAGEINEGLPYIQSAAEIIEQGPQYYAEINHQMNAVLQYLTRKS